jgi:hypothetical protein
VPGFHDVEQVGCFRLQDVCNCVRIILKLVLSEYGCLDVDCIWSVNLQWGPLAGGVQLIVNLQSYKNQGFLSS